MKKMAHPNPETPTFVIPYMSKLGKRYFSLESTTILHTVSCIHTVLGLNMQLRIIMNAQTPDSLFKIQKIIGICHHIQFKHRWKPNSVLLLWQVSILLTDLNLSIQLYILDHKSHNIYLPVCPYPNYTHITCVSWTFQTHETFIITYYQIEFTIYGINSTTLLDHNTNFLGLIDHVIYFKSKEKNNSSKSYLKSKDQNELREQITINYVVWTL